MKTVRLYDVAKIIRSKNSGPFQITLDVLFDDPNIYETIKAGNLITKEIIAKAYHIETSKIQELVFFDAALGFKITFERSISSGTCGDRDVYGAQQHGPLMEIMINIDDGGTENAKRNSQQH